MMALDKPLNEQWVTMRAAAATLGVSASKISRLAARGKIRTIDDPLDERVRLVEMNELKALFESSPRRRQ